MVICCVPKCCTDSNKSESSITFHDFPSNPDLAAKWITQINTFLNNGNMWFPRGKSVVCSKHFLKSDFKPDSNTLRPRCFPSVFGYPAFKTANRETYIPFKRKSEFTSSPLIVKVLRPSENRNKSEHPFSSNQTLVQEQLENNFNATQNFSNVTNEIDSLQECSPSPTIQSVFSIQSLREQVSNVLKPISQPVGSNSGVTSCQNANLGNSTFITNMCNYGAKEKQNVTMPTSPHLYCKRPQKKIISPSKKPHKIASDLIEIGPNTFLKINPDIIKVNKKKTPSGNTVLQFIMNQKLAMSQGDNFLPKLIQNVTKSVNDVQDKAVENQINIAEKIDTEPEIQHVLGHMVDTHICKDSCTELKKAHEDSEHCAENESSNLSEHVSKDVTDPVEVENCQVQNETNLETDITMNDDSACMAKAPILLTTNVPFSHYFNDKTKYSILLRQKSRQIASLNVKISKLNQRIEELEDKCIVQERQLSYSFIKRIKTIRKYATKGDAAATYILEQIRGFAGKNRTLTRWSDSTLTQCAIWCRKAPYAYEYFKKAKFFNLPALGTVKRYIKTHPDIKFVNSKPSTSTANPDDDGSSSDFDFDETDSDTSEKCGETDVACETILSVPSEQMPSNQDLDLNSEHSQLPDENTNDMSQDTQGNILDSNNIQEEDTSMSKQQQDDDLTGEEPIEMDRSNLEIQELILPSGEVVQCISSALCNGQDGNQYYIIPTAGNEQTSGDHQYSIVQSDSIPVILQNIENSDLPSEQQELIFITNSGDQVECSQTEIASA